MKKNGFTLVELLAVILIIGLIASIAVISVDKTLKNSKNSLSKVQIKTIEESAEAYYIKEGMQENRSCVDVEDLISKGYIEENEVIDPKTKKPMEGSVAIKYEANQYSYKYHEDACKQFIAAATEETKTLAGKVPQGNFELGDEYIVNVDGIHSYHFYVLSTEGDKVNLIMSNNICSDGTLATSTNTCSVSWYLEADTSYGPTIAMNYLYEATKEWSNIDNIEMNYIDENDNYGKILTTGNITTITKKDGTVTATYKNLKARLSKVKEIENVGCTSNVLGSCPVWIVNGLVSRPTYYPVGTKEDIQGIECYWNINSQTYYGAPFIDSMGVYSMIEAYNDSGIRPVIEIEKSIIISQTLLS